MKKRNQILFTLLSLSIIGCSATPSTSSSSLIPSSESISSKEEVSTSENATSKEEVSTSSEEVSTSIEESISSEEEVSSEEHVHNYGEWKIVQEPTNDNTGKATRSCECSETEEVTLPVLSDTLTWTKTIISAPTCEENGQAEYTSIYGKVIVTIDALNHEYGTPTYTWSEDNNTCEAKVVCNNDSTHVIKEIVRSTVQTVDATCSAEGSAHYEVTFENQLFSPQTKDVVIPKVPHTFVDNYMGNYTCSVCNHSEYYSYHHAQASVLNYYNQNVDEVADFSGWQNTFKIAEKDGDITWMSKISDVYSVAYFNAFDYENDQPVFFTDYVMTAYIKCLDSADPVTMMQLYIGTSTHKYSIPLYSNQAVNLFDCTTNTFVDNAFQWVAFPQNEAVFVQIMHRMMPNGNAKISCWFNGQLGFSVETAPAINGDFGFDVPQGSNWMIGSPGVLRIEN